MKTKYFGLILPLLLIFAGFVKADMAPDDGFARVSSDLILETKEDLSDYRFFLDFFGDLRGIAVKNNAQTKIAPMGGGARYRAGTLWAVPRKSLADFGETSTKEQIGELSEALKNQKIAGALKLTTHQFVMDLPVSEKENWTPPVYVIERVENSLKITQTGTKKIENKTESFLQSSKLVLMATGILTALAVLIGGIILFRRNSKK